MGKIIVKSVAQVGRDMINDAEYFIYEDKIFDKIFEEEKGFKGKIKKVWYIITAPYYRIKCWLNETYWKIYYGFERMFKGYDSVDVFELFAKFTERYYNILVELKKTHYGHPMEMSEKEWEDIIDEMLYHLYYMIEDNVNDELSREAPDGWTPSGITVYKIMNKHKEEFFKLFSKYFFSLWD